VINLANLGSLAASRRTLMGVSMWRMLVIV
jgi:hypothetical protein